MPYIVARLFSFHLYYIRPNGEKEEDFSVSHWDAGFQAGDTENRVSVSLSPGQMKVFRLP